MAAANDKSFELGGSNQINDFVISCKSELFFGVNNNKDAKAYLTLLSGSAEIFGTELVLNKRYEFGTGTHLVIFTLEGCKLNLFGQMYTRYVSNAPSTTQFSTCHKQLEMKRALSKQIHTQAPMAMVVGSPDVGKSTLCRVLVNNAVRAGWKPIYVDLDVGQGDIGMPGTIGSAVMEHQVDVEEGFAPFVTMIKHFGFNAPFFNVPLYKMIVQKMGLATLERLNIEEQVKHSGVIINTCGWANGVGYQLLLHAAKAFMVNTIYVIDDLPLQNSLKNNVPRRTDVVLLTKNSAVVVRERELRQELRNKRIRNYFYGYRAARSPFSFEVDFKDLKIFKIFEKRTQLLEIEPNPSLLNRILTVTGIQELHDVIGSNAVGFVCVTAVNMTGKTVTLLSSQPGPLPGGILLQSDIMFSNTPKN